MLSGYTDGFVQITSVDHVIAAEELTGFGEGTIVDQSAVFADPDARRGCHGIERRGTDILATSVQFVCELCRFRLRGSQGGGAGFVPGLFVIVAQEHVTRVTRAVGRWRSEP